MSYSRERKEFIGRMTGKGFDLDTLRSLLRYASTLQRLAVTQCNGDYPADNGERKVVPCVRCECLWVPSSLNKDRLCKDCRTADLVRQALPQEWKPVFGGDPRGAVLRLAPVDMSDSDIDSGRGSTVYVPAR